MNRDTTMEYAIGTLVVIALLWVIAKAATSDRYSKMTEEEFEAEAGRSSSLGAAVAGFQKLIDPSHGVGVRRWIRPLCRAAKAVGANGILIEVHPNPAEAKSDADQALTFGDFEQIVADLARIPLVQDGD